MTTSRLLLILAGLGVVAAAACAAVLARPDLFMAVAPAPPSIPARLANADPLAALPADLAERLVRPRFDAPGPFIRVARAKPEAFCKRLAEVELKNATFQKAEPPMRGWTCTTDLVKPVDGDDQAVSSLFVAIRGQESDRIENIRMKLNLIDPATVPVVMAIGRDVLHEIFRMLGFPPPPEAVEALEGLKQGRVLDRGVAFDLRKEFGDATRYNFIILFPRTLGPGGEDRFVNDRRRSAVAP